MEFKAFSDIPRLDKVEMTITQKLHGSNAQIVIIEEKNAIVGNSPTILLTDGKTVGLKDAVVVNDKRYMVYVGSRTRWITPEKDNYGFAAYVQTNKEKIVELLGVGRHDGEWIGLGINSGEGLKEKTFALFSWWEFPPERPLPPQMTTVPVLYRGPFDTDKIKEVMEELKTSGSKLVSGFMRPKGVVISVLGHRVKAVFQKEDTKWDRPAKEKVKKEKVERIDVSHLLQPIRMEKLLSRDESFIKGFPSTLPDLCRAYIADLEKEDQFGGVDEEAVELIKKSLAGRVFGFAKAMVIRQKHLQSGEKT